MSGFTTRKEDLLITCLKEISLLIFSGSPVVDQLDKMINELQEEIYKENEK